MKKLVVVILGFLVGSILPIAASSREIMLYAMLIAAIMIILCCCSSNDAVRFFAIFIPGIMLGCCTIELIPKWNEVAKEISMGLLVLLAMIATVMLGMRSEEEKRHSKKSKEMMNDAEKQT